MLFLMNRGRKRGADWLSPETYDALSPAEKRAIWLNRKQQHRGSARHARNRKRSTPDAPWISFGVIAVLVVAAAAWELTPARSSSRGVAAAPGATAVRASFGLCHTGGGTNCVVDGDTIWLAGKNIRIADIDAPETHEYRCQEEKALGDRATQRLHQLVNSGSVTLGSIDRDQDVYGRKLRLVFVDGVGVGDTLVNEGLARYYRGGSDRGANTSLTEKYQCD